MDRGEIKKTADRLEKWLAKYLEGYRIPGSGSIESFKGDVQWGEYLVDSKNTVKASQSLLGTDLTKITSEGRGAGRTGHLILSYLTNGITGDHWAVVPYDAFEEMPETTEEEVLAQGSKQIGVSYLKSVKKRAFRKGKVPSIKIHFSKIALGTPREWLIIPLEFYRDHFGDNFE